MEKEHQTTLADVEKLLQSNDVDKALEMLRAVSSAPSEVAIKPSPTKKRKINVHPPKGEPRKSVTVRVPATTANLGPAFDTIGMALDVWNELTVERADKFEMIVHGEGASQVPNNQDNLICEGLKIAFDYVGMEVPTLRYTCRNKIPFGRGLGSSSGAIVSGLIAGLAIAGHELAVYGQDSTYRGGAEMEPEELLQLASNMEGHPDNVCPCLYGGIHLAIKIERDMGLPHWRSSRVDCAFDMQLVAFVPDKVGETKTLRAVLPDSYSREDAVFNIGRTAFLVNALAKGRLHDLKFGHEDVMHQSQRGKAVYHHLEPIIEAAEAAGAHGAYLSGAGPTVLAITSGAATDIHVQDTRERCEYKIAEAMIAAAVKADWPGRCFITRPSLQGAHISAADPPYSKGVLEYLGGKDGSQPL